MISIRHFCKQHSFHCSARSLCGVIDGLCGEIHAQSAFQAEASWVPYDVVIYGNILIANTPMGGIAIRTRPLPSVGVPLTAATVVRPLKPGSCCAFSARLWLVFDSFSGVRFHWI
jgi:hypothetical protein